MGDAGIVDSDGQRAESCLDIVSDSLDAGSIGHIKRPGLCGAAGGSYILGDLASRAVAQVGHGNAGPSAAKARQMAAPMPLPAPVTTATVSLSLIASPRKVN